MGLCNDFHWSRPTAKGANSKMLPVLLIFCLWPTMLPGWPLFINFITIHYSQPQEFIGHGSLVGHVSKTLRSTLPGAIGFRICWLSRRFTLQHYLRTWEVHEPWIIILIPQRSRRLQTPGWFDRTIWVHFSWPLALSLVVFFSWDGLALDLSYRHTGLANRYSEGSIWIWFQE